MLLVNLIPCAGLDLSVHYCLFQSCFLPCILFCLHAHRTTVVLSPRDDDQCRKVDYSVDLPGGYRGLSAFKRTFAFQFIFILTMMRTPCSYFLASMGISGMSKIAKAYMDGV
jgi:hypothetical protein